MADNKSALTAEQKKQKKQNRILIGAIIAVVVIVGLVFAIEMNKDKNSADKPQEVEDTIYGDDSLGIDADVDKELRNFRNIFIFGTDNQDRSDIILLASINEKTNQVKLISVHRDTYMQLREEGESFYIGGTDREFFKCNHAYKKGGFYAAMKELNMNMDLNCHEGMGLDWSDIALMINTIGGLDVDVSDSMYPYVNHSGPGGISQPGQQTLDGAQAVSYLRTRHDATAVQRAARNQDAFVQIFEKAKTLSKSDQLDMLDKIYARVDSNMSKGTMTEILDQLSNYKLETMGDWPHDWHLYWDSDMAFYYFLPQTLAGNVTKLHQEMFGQKDYTPSELCQAISDRIEENAKTMNVGADNFGQ